MHAKSSLIVARDFEVGVIWDRSTLQQTLHSEVSFLLVNISSWEKKHQELVKMIPRFVPNLLEQYRRYSLVAIRRDKGVSEGAGIL
jgi:hypothetical protein